MRRVMLKDRGSSANVSLDACWFLFCEQTLGGTPGSVQEFNPIHESVDAVFRPVSFPVAGVQFHVDVDVVIGFEDANDV